MAPYVDRICAVVFVLGLSLATLPTQLHPSMKGWLLGQQIDCVFGSRATLINNDFLIKVLGSIA